MWTSFPSSPASARSAARDAVAISTVVEPILPDAVEGGSTSHNLAPITPQSPNVPILSLGAEAHSATTATAMASRIGSL
eukprot:1281997-Pyramimonas_sp.AAC.1